MQRRVTFLTVNTGTWGSRSHALCECEGSSRSEKPPRPRLRWSCSVFSLGIALLGRVTSTAASQVSSFGDSEAGCPSFPSIPTSTSHLTEPGPRLPNTCRWASAAPEARAWPLSVSGAALSPCKGPGPPCCELECGSCLRKNPFDCKGRAQRPAISKNKKNIF